MLGAASNRPQALSDAAAALLPGSVFGVGMPAARAVRARVRRAAALRER
jgi:hypothetical protein